MKTYKDCLALIKTKSQKNRLNNKINKLIQLLDNKDSLKTIFNYNNLKLMKVIFKVEVIKLYKSKIMKKVKITIIPKTSQLINFNKVKEKDQIKIQDKQMKKNKINKRHNN